MGVRPSLASTNFTTESASLDCRYDPSLIVANEAHPKIGLSFSML